MIRYKINILDSLKEHGYNSNRLRKEKIFGQATIQAFRSGKVVYGDGLDKLCALLNCQPGDILEHVFVEEDQHEQF